MPAGRGASSFRQGARRMGKRGLQVAPVAVAGMAPGRATLLRGSMHWGSRPRGTVAAHGRARAPLPARTQRAATNRPAPEVAAVKHCALCHTRRQAAEATRRLLARSVRPTHRRPRRSGNPQGCRPVLHTPTPMAGSVAVFAALVTVRGHHRQVGDTTAHGTAHGMPCPPSPRGLFGPAPRLHPPHAAVGVAGVAGARRARVGGATATQELPLPLGRAPCGSAV